MVLTLFIALTLTGCSEIGYYMQGAKGQLAIRAKEQPIERLIDNRDTDKTLSEKLQLTTEILAFAKDELLLEPGGSYQTYADLERPYVVWNIVATPRYDTRPKTWCFPIAGCVSYRGYFSQSEAGAFAKNLETSGYDVHLYGVSAYSTLGWFNDPLLNTFINYPEPELASLLFHELAHQKLYVKDDSRFSEAFAESVAQEGVSRWLSAKEGGDHFATFKKRQTIRAEFARMITGFKEELQSAYDKVERTEEKERIKSEMFEVLQNRYKQLKEEWNGYSGYDHIIGDELNNARLTAIATYHDLLPAFKRLIMQSAGDLNIFYQQVSGLAELNRDKRAKALTEINKGNQASK